MPDSLFTLIAQIVNFLIIVLVLRVLLFKRILAAIDGRQKEIASAHEKAEEHEEEAKKQQQEMEKRLEQFGAEREELVQKVEEEAESRKKELIQNAKEQADEKRQLWETRVEKEGAQFIEELKHQTSKELLRLARRVLDDLADEDLDKRMARKMISKTGLEDKSLREAFQSEDEVMVISSFSMPEDLKKEFQDAVGKAKFSTTDEFHGVAVEAGGKRIAWTIETWLEDFGEEMEKRLSEARSL